MKKYNWELEEVPEKITYKHFLERMLPFNATLTGVINLYKNSPSATMKDAFPELYN
jgi:hypothetical protein